MHKGIYTNERGEVFQFGVNNVWQMQGANGTAVTLNLTEGYGNIGNTVNGSSVSGGTLTITGAFSTSVTQAERKAMQRVFSALTTGTLIVDDTYSIDVNVKSTPAFSRNGVDGKFSLQLYAPIPFFSSKAETAIDIGGITPMFRFPVNYSTPHMFGQRSPNKYKTIINNGSYPTDMTIEFKANATCGNFVVTNLETLKKTTFSEAVLLESERLVMTRNNQGLLTVTHYNALEVSTNVLYLLDDTSELFQLAVGTNIIQGEALSGNEALEVKISYKERVELDV